MLHAHLHADSGGGGGSGHDDAPTLPPSPLFDLPAHATMLASASPPLASSPEHAMQHTAMPHFGLGQRAHEHVSQERSLLPSPPHAAQASAGPTPMPVPPAHHSHAHAQQLNGHHSPQQHHSPQRPVRPSQQQLLGSLDEFPPPPPPPPLLQQQKLHQQLHAALLHAGGPVVAAAAALEPRVSMQQPGALSSFLLANSASGAGAGVVSTGGIPAHMQIQAAQIVATALAQQQQQQQQLQKQRARTQQQLSSTGFPTTLSSLQPLLTSDQQSKLASAAAAAVAQMPLAMQMAMLGPMLPHLFPANAAATTTNSSSIPASAPAIASSAVSKVSPVHGSLIPALSLPSRSIDSLAEMTERKSAEPMIWSATPNSAIKPVPAAVTAVSMPVAPAFAFSMPLAATVIPPAVASANTSASSSSKKSGSSKRRYASLSDETHFRVIDLSTRNALTPAQISAQLGVKQKTVYTILHRYKTQGQIWKKAKGGNHRVDAIHPSEAERIRAVAEKNPDLTIKQIHAVIQTEISASTNQRAQVAAAMAAAAVSSFANSNVAQPMPMQMPLPSPQISGTVAATSSTQSITMPAAPMQPVQPSPSVALTLPFGSPVGPAGASVAPSFSIAAMAAAAVQALPPALRPAVSAVIAPKPRSLQTIGRIIKSAGLATQQQKVKAANKREREHKANEAAGIRSTPPTGEPLAVPAVLHPLPIQGPLLQPVQAVQFMPLMPILPPMSLAPPPQPRAQQEQQLKQQPHQEAQEKPVAPAEQPAHMEESAPLEQPQQQPSHDETQQPRSSQHPPEPSHEHTQNKHALSHDHDVHSDTQLHASHSHSPLPHMHSEQHDDHADDASSEHGVSPHPHDHEHNHAHEHDLLSPHVHPHDLHAHAGHLPSPILHPASPRSLSLLQLQHASDDGHEHHGDEHDDDEEHAAHEHAHHTHGHMLQQQRREQQQLEELQRREQERAQHEQEIIRTASRELEQQ